jgi:tetratricopeptide (TPR) repeat protein
VRAALELRQAARPLNDGLGRRVGIRLETRTGVSTGEVIVASSARGHRLIGEAVNLAAGLQRLAGRQEIVLGEATAQLVWRVASLEPLPRSAGETTATAPRSEFRLLGLVPEGPAQARRLVAPSVGREAELHLLREAFQRAVSERSCHLFTVLGPAGIGKTRLVSDFARTVDTQAVVISGHCPSYGDGITFLPVAEAIRGLAGITGDDAPEVARERLVALLEGVPDAAGIVDRVAVALGLAELSTTAEGVNWSIQRLLEAAARRRPLVVVFDDVHWGEPTFLDLVELIVDWTQGTPMLVVCTGRWPELLQRRPSWGGGKPNATSILLGPLEPDQSQQLLGRLLGQDDLPEGLAAHVNAAAEGNPLFVEEMVAMLMDGGQLRREHGRWRLTVDVARIPLPPTIRVLLEARLDQLPHLQQVILERAAVVGKSFSPEAVAALSPTSERPGLMAQLLALAGKDLIRRGQGELAEQAAFAFRHQLIRDAAYRRQPERVRAELHERLGTWLESIAGPGHTDWEELAAHHLEQACRYRANLGQVDAPLARRAANLLAAAGQRASDRWDHRAASSLLQRARSLPLDDDLFRLEVTPALVASLGYQGHMREAGDLASRGIELARKLGERRLEARVRIEQQLNAWSDAEQWSAEEALGEIERAIPLFRESGDDRGLAAAWLLTARIDNMLLRWAAMEAPLRRTILHSRHVGDQGRVLSGLNLLGLTFLYGPYPVPEAVRRLEEIIHAAGDNRIMSAAMHGGVARLEAMRGDFDRAWGLLADASRVLEDTTKAVSLIPRVMHGQAVAQVASLAGDYPRAESALRVTCRLLEEAGATGVLSTDLALLADALYAQGHDHEAEELTRTSERFTSQDDVMSQFQWRSVRAKLLARRGEVEEAQRLSAEAVDFARLTDAINLQADVWMARAEVLRRSGRATEAVRTAQQALDLYVRKDNLVSAGRARLFLADLSDVRVRAGG